MENLKIQNAQNTYNTEKYIEYPEHRNTVITFLCETNLF